MVRKNVVDDIIVMLREHEHEFVLDCLFFLIIRNASFSAASIYALIYITIQVNNNLRRRNLRFIV